MLLWPGSCFVTTLCVHRSQNFVDLLITICRHATYFWDFNVLPTTMIPVGNIVAHWYQWNKRASKNHQPISGSPSPLFPKKNLPDARNNSACFSWSLFLGEKFHWGSFPNCLILYICGLTITSESARWRICQWCNAYCCIDRLLNTLISIADSDIDVRRGQVGMKQKYRDGK